MNFLKKLSFIILLVSSMSYVSASRESIEELITELHHAAQRFELSSEYIEVVVQEALRDSEFDSDTKEYLIDTLRFASHSAETLEDDEVISTIERCLSVLHELENSTPPMTQHSQEL